jgi:hypothetical protein
VRELPPHLPDEVGGLTEVEGASGQGPPRSMVNQSGAWSAWWVRSGESVEL